MHMGSGGGSELSVIFRQELSKGAGLRVSDKGTRSIIYLKVLLFLE